jgi:hypothetical protein
MIMGEGFSKYLPFLAVTDSASRQNAVSTEMSLISPFYAKYNSVVFVKYSDLIETPPEDCCSKVFAVIPACARQENEPDPRQRLSTRFQYGLYYKANKLLLMDDVIEWSQKNLDFLDIRNASNIAKILQGGGGKEKL